MAKPIGVVLYQGPSRIDGAPIVVIATFRTKNTKTGNMVQTWILRRFIDPISAINDGRDYSVCGNCPLRGIISARRNRGRGCYVKIDQAPRAVYSAYRRGSYPRFDRPQHAKYFYGRKLRLGAYGDPVAAPLAMWRPIMQLCAGWTGYTHQWREAKFYHWARYVMASTHSLAENTSAQARGWRTFRTLRPGATLHQLEVVCPASAESSLDSTCERCGGCNGNYHRHDRRRSFAIFAHGSPSVLGGVINATT